MIRQIFKFSRKTSVLKVTFGFEKRKSKLARITFWTIDWDVFRSVMTSLENITDSIDEHFISFDDRPIKYIHIYVADGSTSTADFTGLEKYKNIFIIQGQDNYYPTRKVPPCSSATNDVSITDEVSGKESHSPRSHNSLQIQQIAVASLFQIL